VKKVLPYDSGSNVVDRYAFGRELLEQTAALGVDQHFDTVVNGVLQDDQVEGVEAVRDGAPVTYHADLVVDAGGSLSTVMAAVDFDDLAAAPRQASRNPTTSSSGPRTERYSAHQKTFRTTTRSWESPRGDGVHLVLPADPREINVGLGFQMNKDPIELVDRLREDVQDRPEYQGAEHDEVNGTADKLGAALGLRRPLDSMVAPGYVTVGCNAGATHPISGRGSAARPSPVIRRGNTVPQPFRRTRTGSSPRRTSGPTTSLRLRRARARNENRLQRPYNVAASKAGMENVRAAVALLPEDGSQTSSRPRRTPSAWPRPPPSRAACSGTR